MLIAILYLVALAIGFANVLTIHATTVPAIAATLLRWYFLIAVGTTLIIAGIGHALKGDFTAKRLNWPAGNPFQKEVGYWDFAVGVVSVMAFWWHGNFWLAAATVNVVFWTLAGALHVYELVEHRNRQLDNALPAVMDIVGAATLLTLYLLANKL